MQFSYYAPVAEDTFCRVVGLICWFSEPGLRGRLSDRVVIQRSEEFEANMSTTQKIRIGPRLMTAKLFDQSATEIVDIAREPAK